MSNEHCVLIKEMKKKKTRMKDLQTDRQADRQ